jgi:hypothetical protein
VVIRLLGGDVDVGVDVLLQLGLAVLVPVVYHDTDNVVAMETFLTQDFLCRKYIFRSI